MRDAVYASLEARHRSSIHRSAAIALEAECGESLGPQCAQVAVHFDCSIGSQERARAISWLRKAAAWEMKRSAFDEAAAHLDRAIRLAGELRTGDRELRCELLILKGEAESLGGNRQEARSVLLEGAQLARECRRFDLMSQAALLHAPDLLAIETGVCDLELIRLLREAHSALGPTDRRRPQILARLAVALHWSDEGMDEIPRILELAKQGLPLSGDPSIEQYVQVADLLATYSVLDPQGRLQRCANSVSVTGDVSTALMQGVLRITSLLQLGRIGAAEEEIRAFARLVENRKRRSAHWYIGMFEGTLALMKGQFEKAAESRRAYLRAGLEVQDENALHSFALQEAVSAIDNAGLDESIRQGVTSMIGQFPRVEGWKAGLAYLLTEMRLHAEAAELIDEMWNARVFECRHRNAWFGTMCSLCLAADALGLRHVAAELYARMRQFSGQVAVVGFGSLCWGSVDRFLGIMAGRSGENDRGLRHLDIAARVNRALGAGPALAYTYRDTARLLSRIGSADAGRYWEIAFRMANELGMKRLESDVSAEACS